ncbi:PREDICTED: uncharacterized protein C1orf64 homolog [Elephantulus edwardii]|uniref:uncharacterized protein C1orf64 homolog n=1 Tax=Elephantulus edwardii TaxID=28737 RepID=UPI0003F07385|nr:PREDICTED: uncharacterized protein C1orf64 homolog [Elephantulus edwardii]
MSLRPRLESSSGEKLIRHRKAIPTAHLTFIIDLTCGRQVSLAAPLVQPQVPRHYEGPVTSPMKTHVVFCGQDWPHKSQEAPFGRECPAQTGDTLPLSRDIRGSASRPVSSLCPQKGPEPTESHLKAVPTRSSAWGTVKGSLKALSSCVCGQVE